MVWGGKEEHLNEQQILRYSNRKFHPKCQKIFIDDAFRKLNFSIPIPNRISVRGAKNRGGMSRTLCNHRYFPFFSGKKHFPSLPRFSLLYCVVVASQQWNSLFCIFPFSLSALHKSSSLEKNSQSSIFVLKPLQFFSFFFAGREET